ncbi:type II toxin-antitoxin system antitoxin [Paradesulfitobacterium aromaticivorans]
MSSKKQFPLRLDPKLYQALERWATDEFRSVNAHIEFLLREAARRAGRLRDERMPRSADNAGEEPDPSNAE